MSIFTDWTCTFPGKMGLSWKRAWHGVGTKEVAEDQAAKSCNAVAVPLQLFEKMKEHERRMVVAERERDALMGLIVRAWTREGDGKRLWKINLGWWETADTEAEAVAIVRKTAGLSDSETTKDAQ